MLRPHRHGHFPTHTVTYLGDDMYVHQPFCHLITETYRQFFVFVCKPEAHPTLYEWLDFLDKTHCVAVVPLAQVRRIPWEIENANNKTHNQRLSPETQLRA